MRPMMTTVLGLMVSATLSTDAAELVAQSANSKAAPTPACALLSVAEVRQLTGRKEYPDYVDGDKPGEGLGGGSSCQYGSLMSSDPPLISVVLIPRTGAKTRPAAQRGFKLGEGCRRDDVKGIGDDAVLEVCPKARGPIIYVAAGKSDLLVQADSKPPATAEWAKSTVQAVAKAAAAKVR